MQENYIYDEQESFDALPLFKAVFGHLIDPSITAIVCDLNELSVYRGGLSDAHFSQSIPLQSLINFQYKDSDERIQQMYKTIYNGHLAVFEYLEHRELEYRSIQEIKPQLFELIPYLPPVFFKEMKFFGEVEYLYEMHKNHFLMPFLTEQQDESKWSLIRTTNQIIASFSEGATKTEQAISKKMLLKLKQNYLQENSHSQLDENIETIWDELGKAVYENNLGSLQERLEKDCNKAFSNLDANDEKMISLALFDFGIFSLEECAQYESEDFGCFYAPEDFISPLIENLMHHAQLDWEIKAYN